MSNIVGSFKGTQLVVSLANEPGTLAGLCAALGEAVVNITAIDVSEAKGSGRVRVMVDDLDEAKRALRGAKIRFSEEEVMVVELDNRPGALGELAGKLSQSKINIKYAYASTTAFARARVIVAVPDVAKVLRVLGR
jgi:hypothetical protein